MPQVSDLCTLTKRWQLAVEHAPAHLARCFAESEGDFYDRDKYDALAQCVFEALLNDESARAWEFRGLLDQRLYDRYKPPVRWERRRQPWPERQRRRGRSA